MDWLLSWQTLVFLVPLLAGAALVGGLALGFVGDADVDGDGHVDAHLAHPDHHHDVLSVLGIGRVPLTIVLLCLALVFGATGIASNALLGELLPRAYPFVSLGLAAVAAVVGTGRLARLIARVAPTLETYVVRKQDLVGRTGRAIVEVTDADGFIQVTDHEGNVQQVRSRSTGALLAKGARLLVVDYDRSADRYLVEPFDPDAPADADARQPSRARETE